MRELLAVVVHLTDLHLLVDDAGHEVPAREAGRVISMLRWLGARHLERHNNVAWMALRHRLPQIVASERDQIGDEVPILVLQTGDVEAYGMGPEPVPFAGFTVMQDSVWPELKAAGATECVDVFGNHDVWNRSLPLTGRVGPRRVLDKLRDRHDLGADWPDCVSVSGPGASRIDVYRVNSVTLDRVRGLLAMGWVSSLPDGAADGRTDRAVEGLTALGERAGDGEGPVVGLLMLHHPLHPFDADTLVRATTNRVLGASELAAAAHRMGIHAVVAGHRHALNPARNAVLDAATASQPPLLAGTVQLVAESPTQARKHAYQTGRGETSFSMYRIWHDPPGGLDVDRVLYRSADRLGPHPDDQFTPSASESLVRGLTL